MEPVGKGDVDTAAAAVMDAVVIVSGNKKDTVHTLARNENETHILVDGLPNLDSSLPNEEGVIPLSVTNTTITGQQHVRDGEIASSAEPIISPTPVGASESSTQTGITPLAGKSLAETIISTGDAESITINDTLKVAEEFLLRTLLLKRLNADKGEPAEHNEGVKSVAPAEHVE
ncbi:hypothetical protein HDV05_008153, partial [Chytridiales sp. JEL 0842]